MAVKKGRSGDRKHTFFFGLMKLQKLDKNSEFLCQHFIKIKPLDA